jgi:hypothetical protein
MQKNNLTNHVRELNLCLGEHYIQLQQMILTCKAHVSLIIKGKPNGTNKKENFT